MTETTKVTDKGQTIIPKEIRDKFGIEPGDEVVWEITDEGVILRRADPLNGYGFAVDEDLDDEEREEIASDLEDELYERRETEWTVE
jgi:AbrB family looped-hinge helix DNA binding protein